MYRSPIRERIEAMPLFDRAPHQVPAACFNQARLAMLRLDCGMRLPVDGLHHLELIVERDAWVAVDVRQNDVPVLAWVDFETGARSSLHLPVACQRVVFDARARELETQILQSLVLFTRTRLRVQEQEQAAAY